jgi:hypothetical protein
MHKDARECLERATECARLAESVEHPELKLYLTKFAVSWAKVASETVELDCSTPDSCANLICAQSKPAPHR